MVQSFVKSYRAPPNRRPGYILGKFGAKMGKVAGYVAESGKRSAINQVASTKPDFFLHNLI